MKLTLNLGEFGTEATRQIAYAVAHAGPGLRTRGLEMAAYRQLRDIIAELDSRAFGGDTSELKEMADHWGKGIESRRIKPAKARRFDAQYEAAKLAIEADDRRRTARKSTSTPADQGIAAVKADDAARKSGAGAPGSLDTSKSPAERDALRAKEWKI